MSLVNNNVKGALAKAPFILESLLNVLFLP